MRFGHVVVGAAVLLLSPGCILIDQLLAEDDDTCGGNPRETIVSDLALPRPLATTDDFYIGTDGDRRVMRWSVLHSNVCSEEHVDIAYRVDYARTLELVLGTGDATPYPLFGDEVTLRTVASNNDYAYLEGHINLGLKQWYEGVPGEFVAGIEVTTPAVSDDVLYEQLLGAKITTVYRIAPPPEPQ